MVDRGQSKSMVPSPFSIKLQSRHCPSSAHKCLQCKNPVNTICGTNPDGLGFGVLVVCNTCQTKDNNGENALIYSQVCFMAALVADLLQNNF